MCGVIFRLVDVKCKILPVVLLKAFSGQKLM